MTKKQTVIEMNDSYIEAPDTKELTVDELDEYPVTHDSFYDLSYVHINESEVYKTKQLEIAGYLLMLDVDKENNPIGIEIVANKRLTTFTDVKKKNIY